MKLPTLHHQRPFSAQMSPSNSFDRNTDGVSPSGCNRDENCRRCRSVRYPCGIGRWCDREVCVNDPACLTRKALCRSVYSRMENHALAVASDWKDDQGPGSDADFNDCVTVVAAASASAGAAVGAGAGPGGAALGAALGAGSGVAFGRMACRRIL